MVVKKSSFLFFKLLVVVVVVEVSLRSGSLAVFSVIGEVFLLEWIARKELKGFFLDLGYLFTQLNEEH